jgi:ligand-binding sensor domain-containing protein
MKLKPYQFKKIIFASLFLILNATSSIKGRAQKVSDFIFDTYLIKEGMSQSTSMSIYQDKVGYIWVGTQSGVDRFDGYTFKQYAHDLKNNQTRSAGWVLDITEDKDGNIWTVDNQGHFSKLNRASDQWSNFTLPFRDSLVKKNKSLRYNFGTPRSIYVDSLTNQVWLGTNGLGLVSYNTITKKLTQFLVHPEAATKYGPQERVAQVRSLSANKLIVATDQGVQTFDTKTNKFATLFNSKDSLFLALPTDLKVIGTTIYVTNQYGAYIYNTKTGTLQTFKHENGNENSIASNNVNGIHYSPKSNYLWLSIIGEGIDVINLANNKVVHLNKNNAKDNGITESNYENIFEDKDHNIWVGTAISGLLKYDPGKRVFGLMTKTYPSDFNLGINSSWGMMVDSKGIIWLGEYETGGGLLAIDRAQKTKKAYLKNINGTTLRSWKICEDNKGNIFAFTGSNSNGLVVFYKASNSDEFKKLGYANDLLNQFSQSVNGSSFLNSKKELIVGGLHPIILADSNGNKIFKFFDLPKGLEKGFFDVQRKSKDELYVVNEDGIFLLNESNNKIIALTKNIKFVPSEDIYGGPTLQVIDGKMAFLATYGNGLIKVDFEKQTKVFLTLKDGIPNLYLYDIFAGKDNILWISSNYGIIRYNPYTNKFRSFGPAEGVQGYEFNTNSAFMTPNNEIFYNGVLGLNYFYSEDIKVDTVPPTVIIQKFSTKDSTIYIEAAKPNTTFEIEYQNNNLSFDFIAFNFRDALKNQYAYKMEGYDEDWIYAGTRRFASYTNLREGNYTFRVKAANSDGIWNEVGASMSIKIFPPIGRTWYAYLLYVILISCSVYFFSKYREKKQFKKLEDDRKNGELAEAKALQERLLPKTLPAIKNLDIAGYLRTSTEVGGDYYDFFEQPDGSLYAICGDATGHGTPSGMLVSITKAGIIGLPQMSPKDMLHELNRVVKKVDLGILRMSLNIALIKDNQITLSSAGMPPYFIYRAATNTTEEIQLSGVPLGSFNDVHFDQATTSFNAGDILVIISDGLPEAPNLTGELFDYQKLQDLITTYGDKTAQEVIDQLMIEADAWLSGNHNPDDITLVVIKHK